MQTLRFYTRRIFFVVCIFFFTFLFYLATQKWESNDSKIQYLKRKHARQFKTLDMPGEQLGFQSQPPPAFDNHEYLYHDLNVNRTMDAEIIDRIKMHIRDINFSLLIPHECKKNITLADYFYQMEKKTVQKDDSWERFYAQISSCQLYSDDQVIDELLYDLNKMPVKHVTIMEGGTQVKLILTFENGKQAVFKPMRFGRNYETDLNHFYFGDFERHTAEIATFHLDRILGFRRAVPTIGRVMNMTKELKANAEKRLLKTFFVSPAKNICFVSKCDYYCDTTHAICASPDLKEGSIQAFLPDDNSVPRKHNRSPYRRTYSKKTQKAEWQEDMHYCNLKIKTKKQYSHGRRLLDLIDLHIMDYLIINQDRHHYESFSFFPNEIQSYALHLDNGRAFGRSDIDDEDIILPLRQCCLIRPSTFLKLFAFYSGSKSLTQAFHESLSKDPIKPVLAFKHYNAMERRMHKLMTYILECMDKFPAGQIMQMIQPEYHNLSVPNPAPEDDIDPTDNDDTVDIVQADVGQNLGVDVIPAPNDAQKNAAPINKKKINKETK